MTGGESRNFAKFRSARRGVGGRSEDPPHGSHELPNHLISRCNRDACATHSSLPTLSLPLPPLEEALRSDQAAWFRFRLSVSARFVSRTSRSPHPFRENDAREAESTVDPGGDRWENAGPSRVTMRTTPFRAYRRYSEPSSFFRKQVEMADDMGFLNG